MRGIALPISPHFGEPKAPTAHRRDFLVGRRLEHGGSALEHRALAARLVRREAACVGEVLHERGALVLRQSDVVE